MCGTLFPAWSKQWVLFPENGFLGNCYEEEADARIIEFAARGISAGVKKPTVNSFGELMPGNVALVKIGSLVWHSWPFSEQD